MTRRSNLVMLLVMLMATAILSPASAAAGHLFTAFQGAEPASPADLAPPLPSPSVENVFPATLASPAPACCEPCIQYRTKHRRRKTCCACEPPINIMLAVENPRTCCIVDVPVCIPGCCTDAPSADGRCGIFGRGIVKYQWCCGYKVTVAFNKHGDILVTYHGG
jgi:hypothetical protein